VEEKMVASPNHPNFNMLAILIDQFIASKGPSLHHLGCRQWGGHGEAAARRRRRQGVGDSNKVPHARRYTMAVEYIVAFFVRMGAFVC
jgi:hypothetical protein